jgi:hypothetical protein
MRVKPGRLPIMDVFRHSHQIHLQDITKRDILAVVEDTLLDNQYFQRWMDKDQEKCQKLIALILREANGVFLWVTLLLNLLQDELPSASSIEALQRVVETTPPQLEDFIRKIFNTVRKHHRHGATFIFAMALRMLGFQLSDSGSFPATEQHQHHQIFQNGRIWQPHLPLYGLSAVMEALELGTPIKYKGVLADMLSQDHNTRTREAAAKIETWCRGLLQVFGAEERYMVLSMNLETAGENPPGIESIESAIDSRSVRCSQKVFEFARFTHRSVPESLS